MTVEGRTTFRLILYTSHCPFEYGHCKRSQRLHLIEYPLFDLLPDEVDVAVGSLLLAGAGFRTERPVSCLLVGTEVVPLGVPLFEMAIEVGDETRRRASRVAVQRA